jgi:hypothetical protein
MPEKVFLSYATPDRGFASLLKPRLNGLLATEAESIDLFDLEGGTVEGDDLRQGVRLAIGEASTVVVVTSPESETSDWVNYEVGLADAFEKRLVFVSRKGAGHSALLDRVSREPLLIEIDEPEMVD